MKTNSPSNNTVIRLDNNGEKTQEEMSNQSNQLNEYINDYNDYCKWLYD